MALLSVTTSLNVAEMLALRWKWVNLEQEPAVVAREVLPPRSLGVRENVYRGKFGSPKAKSRKRNVPLPDEVVTALGGLRRSFGANCSEDLVFASQNGTALDEKNLMRRTMKPVAVKLGIPWLGWHVFRHTHATLADQVGMARADRQAQLGHSDFRMTMLYTHADLERRRTSVQAIAAKVVEMANSAEAGNSDTK